MPYEFVVTQDDAGARLDTWLAGREVPFSRSQIARRIQEGEVTLNGEVVREPSRRMRLGDRSFLSPPPPVSVEDRAEDIPLVVLYEDAHLIVIDKPAGLVVHPATSHTAGTLVNALLFHCGEEGLAISGERRPGIVHRLDKDTSGVMVAAKDESTLVGLQSQFAAHDPEQMERRYLALVEGFVAEDGSFKTKHGRDPHDRKKFSSKVSTGKRAVTHWRVVERLTGATLVEARLETGRTHQIRVHFKDHGHPVIGDRLYARPPRDLRVRAVAAALGRQALHAAVLGIVHPATGERMSFRTDPPADMQRAIAALRS